MKPSDQPLEEGKVKRVLERRKTRCIAAAVLVVLGHTMATLCHFGACSAYYASRGADLVWRVIVEFTYWFDRPAFWWDWWTGAGFEFAYESLSLTGWIREYAIYVIVTSIAWLPIAYALILVVRAVVSVLERRARS